MKPISGDTDSHLALTAVDVVPDGWEQGTPGQALLSLFFQSLSVPHVFLENGHPSLESPSSSPSVEAPCSAHCTPSYY